MEKKTIRQVNSELKGRHILGIVCGFLLIPIGILSLVATTFSDVQRNPTLKTIIVIMGILCIVFGLICTIYSIIKYKEL